MDRRRFDHLFVELSVACGQLVPRYRLWLALRECGADPEALARAHVIAFCDEHMPAFLDAEGLWLSSRVRRKLRRSLSRFDPLLPSPTERMASLGAPRHR